MFQIKNLDALVLFDYVKTDEGKDAVENLVYGKPLAFSVENDPDASVLARNIDASVKKISTALPSKNVLKQMAIDKFVLEKKSLLNLSWEQTQNVWNNIMIGIILKTIHSKDFVWKNGKIESISGLDFPDETRVANDARFV